MAAGVLRANRLGNEIRGVRLKALARPGANGSLKREIVFPSWGNKTEAQGRDKKGLEEENREEDAKRRVRGPALLRLPPKQGQASVGTGREWRCLPFPEPSEPDLLVEPPPLLAQSLSPLFSL